MSKTGNIEEPAAGEPCPFGGIGHDPTRAGEGCNGCDKLHADLMDKHVGPRTETASSEDVTCPLCEGNGLMRPDHPRLVAYMAPEQRRPTAQEPPRSMVSWEGAYAIVHGHNQKLALENRALREEIEGLRRENPTPSVEDSRYVEDLRKKWLDARGAWEHSVLVRADLERKLDRVRKAVALYRDNEIITQEIEDQATALLDEVLDISESFPPTSRDRT